MSNKRLPKVSARIACLSLACAWALQSSAHAIVEASQDRPGYGGPDDPIEVILPPEVQAMLFRSLPIAGLLVTPDAIAERVLTNPRSRATAPPPTTGKGEVHPVLELDAVGTGADPPD